jgi:hypothetical protein
MYIRKESRTTGDHIVPWERFSQNLVIKTHKRKEQKKMFNHLFLYRFVAYIYKRMKKTK